LSANATEANFADHAYGWEGPRLMDEKARASAERARPTFKH